ncbi:MAG: 6-bladed beta-propeller [Gaiellaceae bacterium]
MKTDFVVAIGKSRYAVERPWGDVHDGQELAYLSTAAVDSRGRLYLAQRVDPPVVVFAPSGEYLDGWGSGVIADAHGIFVSDDDRVFVVDRDAHQVIVFDSDGNIQLRLGERHRPTLQQPFNHPTGIAVAPGGVIYVSDGYANAAVHRFSPEGELLGSWGSPGSGPGEFMTPHAVAIDAGERVFVADRDNDRVQIFDANGTYIDEWNDFFHPMDIHIDPEGHVHVTDQVPRLSTFSSNGVLVGRCRPVPYMPHGLCGDGTGNLYLVEPSPTDQVTKLVPLGEGR